MTEEALSMDEAKQKLARLEDLITDSPHVNDLVCKFGRFLSERLNPQIVPMGFVMGCELALYDLEKGVNGFTNEPIRNDLVGLPPVIYSLLRMEIPNLADAVFPEDFAKGVRDCIDKANAAIQKQETSA